jgi:hypothetical protein
MQDPVDQKWYTQYGGLHAPVTSSTGYQKGGVTFVRFSEACEITNLGLWVFSVASPTFNYRLGIYEDDGGEPGALGVDAGTLAITSASSAGLNSVALATPYEVAAGQIVWLVCRCNHTSGYPGMIAHRDATLKPYSDYGMSPATGLAGNGSASGPALATVNACAFTSIGDGATALPDPFVLDTPQVHANTPAVYVSVSYNP